MNFLRNPVKNTSSGEDGSHHDSASQSSGPPATSPQTSFLSGGAGFDALGTQFANIRQSVESKAKDVLSVESLRSSKYTNHENIFGSLESYEDSDSEDDERSSSKNLGGTGTLVPVVNRSNRSQQNHDTKSREPTISYDDSKSKRHSNEPKAHYLDDGTGRPASQGTRSSHAKKLKKVKDTGMKEEDALQRAKGNIVDETVTVRSFMDQVDQLAQMASRARDNHDNKLKEIQIQLKASQGRSEDDITQLRDQISALTLLCNSHFSEKKDSQSPTIQPKPPIDPLLRQQKEELEENQKILENEVASLKTNLAKAKAVAERSTAALASKDVLIGNLHQNVEQMRRELENLEQNSKLLRSQVFTLTEKNKQAELQRNSAVKDIGKVLVELEQVKIANKEKEAKITELEGDCSGLRAVLESSQAELQNLKSRFIPTTYNEQVAELKLQLEDKSQKVIELTKRVNQQEERVQRAQEAAFSNLESIKHDFLDDTQVKDQLESDCFGRLLLWAQSYVPRKCAVNATDKELEDELRAVANPKESAQLVQKRPRIVLQALLYQFVARRILSPPFHLYSAGELTQSESFTELLKTLYDIFLSVDEVGCHTWRFHTFQLLEETRQKSSKLTSDTENEQKDMQIQRCQGLAREFIEGPAKSFLGSCESEERRLQELSDIMNNIATLSAKLWGQRVFLKVRGYDHFRDTPYSGSSPHVRAHNIHRLETKGEHSRDGAPIAMVVRPEIVAYGNEEGEEYDQERVWTEAVVLLGEE
ncbi:hypothetical protein TWF506_003803 [Arthrobotrys conoides]|uniref:Uncharacterized protein n=1 Tax=Arthrobotrys conoides TaxID=74498 RepID=A0AAN8RQV9_9PEZI